MRLEVEAAEWWAMLRNILLLSELFGYGSIAAALAEWLYCGVSGETLIEGYGSGRG